MEQEFDLVSWLAGLETRVKELELEVSQLKANADGKGFLNAIQQGLKETNNKNI